MRRSVARNSPSTAATHDWPLRGVRGSWPVRRPHRARTRMGKRSNLMATDRIIQLFTVLAAAVLVSLAGRMLPRIIESAGEAVVLVKVTTGTDNENVTVERIPVSALRELKTVTP